MSTEKFPQFREEISVHDAAKQVIQFVAVEMPRLDPADFEDIIPANEIATDQKYLATLQKKFHDGILHLNQDEQLRVFFGQMVSKALESTIAYHVPTANWFGEGTEFVRPAEFDDVVHGIDGIVEFQTGGVMERLALGVDASRNVQREAITKKIERNVKTILSDEEASRREVKYFASNITDERGPLRDIVPVVIGIEDRSCDELIQLFAEQVNLKKKKPRNAEEQARLDSLTDQLSRHPAQLVFLEQMEMQLSAYDRILSREKTNERRWRLHEKIGALMMIIKEIKQQRIAAGVRMTERFDGDSVMRVVREGLGRYMQ